MALKDKVIVFLGNTRFDSAIRATSLFIARNLAKHNKVFFVDYPFTLKDYFSYNNSDELNARKKKFSFFSEGLIDTDLPNLKIVIVPPVLPINFLPEGPLFRIALKINEFIVSSRLNHILKKNGVTEFVYVNSFNFHYPNIAKHIKPVLTVYQCVDPMVVPYDMKHGVISEDMLVKNSDLVICTSKALYEEKKQQNPNTYFVPNAADVAYFGKALDQELPVHQKIKDLKKPIIGYLGTIERRIDYDLVNAVVKANPDKTFVFAGPVWDNHAASLFNIPNLHVIGPIPYEEVPQLVKGFDVAIIPFKKDEVSKTIFPLKLFEYLGAGKPVILTDFNTDLKDYTANEVWYCHGADAFNNAITEALQTQSEAKIAERIAVAKQNTWEKRSENIGEIISNSLNKQVFKPA